MDNLKFVKNYIANTKEILIRTSSIKVGYFHTIIQDVNSNTKIHFSHSAKSEAFNMRIRSGSHVDIVEDIDMDLTKEEFNSVYDDLRKLTEIR